MLPCPNTATAHVYSEENDFTSINESWLPSERGIEGLAFRDELLHVALIPAFRDELRLTYEHFMSHMNILSYFHAPALLQLICILKRVMFERERADKRACEREIKGKREREKKRDKEGERERERERTREIDSEREKA